MEEYGEDEMEEPEEEIIKQKVQQDEDDGEFEAALEKLKKNSDPT